MNCPECGLKKKPGHHECDCGHVFSKIEYSSKKYINAQIRKAFLWGLFGISFGIVSLEICHNIPSLEAVRYVSIFILCIGIVNAGVGVLKLFSRKQ